MKNLRAENQKPSSHTCYVSATACLVSALLFLPPRSDAQIVLSGLMQQGAFPDTGQTDESPIFHTLAGSSYAKIYLTQPNAGYTAPFLNHGNGADTSISVTLTPGTYQFYFYTASFFGNAPGSPNNPGTYALGLFFDGNNNTSPGIAAFSAAGVISANAVGAGLATLPLTGNTNYPNPDSGTFIPTDTSVPAPGLLTYTADGLTVTLTAYGYGAPGAIGGPGLDRVGNLDDAPDGYDSAVGTFSLTVTPIPEPSTMALACVAVLVVCALRILPNRQLQRSMKTLPLALVLTGLALVCGCAGGPPHDYYNPAISDHPKFKGKPTVEVVDDLEAAKARYLGEGYTVIGTSVYGGDQPKAVELEAQAKRVGASKVIYHLNPPGPGSWSFHVGLWGGGSGGYGVSIIFLGK